MIFYLNKQSVAKKPGRMGLNLVHLEKPGFEGNSTRLIGYLPGEMQDTYAPKRSR